MEEHRTILRRVGIVLILVGLADISFMVYCIIKKLSYSSSLNLCSVIAGVFLWRGHLGTTRFVTSAVAFILGAILSALIFLLPLAQPLDLCATRIRLHPFGTLASLIFAATTTFLMFWIYKQLRAPSVLAARIAAGQQISRPKRAFIMGGLIPIVIAVMITLMVKSDTGAKAVALAQEQLGEDYKYHITAMRSSGSHTSATVTAYNQGEIRSIEVEW